MCYGAIITNEGDSVLNLLVQVLVLDVLEILSPRMAIYRGVATRQFVWR
jgi:hypothetical protein